MAQTEQNNKSHSLYKETVLGVCAFLKTQSPQASYASEKGREGLGAELLLQLAPMSEESFQIRG